MAETMMDGATPPASTTTTATTTEPAATTTTTTTTEPAKTEPAKTEPAKTEPAKTEPAKAPEKYEFKKTDGVDVDEAQISQLAKDLGLTQEAAQKVYDDAVNVQKNYTSKLTEQGTKFYKDVYGATPDQWEAMSKADKEFGGEALDKNMANALRARDQFATPALRKILQASGLGNHPEFVRLFVRVGKALAEDKLVTGGREGVGEKDLAARLYPNHGKK